MTVVKIVYDQSIPSFETSVPLIYTCVVVDDIVKEVSNWDIKTPAAFKITTAPVHNITLKQFER